MITGNIKPINEDNINGKRADQSAHIIVFGNEKGGSGKSTTAMHVAIALLKIGYQVGTIDLDARQGTLTAYMRGRFNFIKKTRKTILSPRHMAINRSQKDSVKEQEKEESSFLEMAIEEFSKKCDFIIIDTPGSDTFLSRTAHSYADTLITPMNDSFIDLALIANIADDNSTVLSPSVYSKMVNQARKAKMDRDHKKMNWIIMRNRVSHIKAKNKHEFESTLARLSKLAKFEIAAGFGDRVIFRELFLKGLTLLDLEEDNENEMSMSEIAARQEVRNLILSIKPEQYKKIKRSVTATISNNNKNT